MSNGSWPESNITPEFIALCRWVGHDTLADYYQAQLDLIKPQGCTTDDD